MKEFEDYIIYTYCCSSRRPTQPHEWATLSPIHSPYLGIYMIASFSSLLEILTSCCKRDTTKFIKSNPWALDKINSMGASNEHGFLAKEKKVENEKWRGGRWIKGKAKAAVTAGKDGI